MKKNIALILSIILCLGLTACGNKEEYESDTDVANSVTVDKEQNTEDEKEIQKLEIPEEYVLADGEQYRMIDTKNVSMQEVCIGYELPFDIVAPVLDFPYEERIVDDNKTFYEIHDSNLKDYYSFAFSMTHKSGKLAKETMDWENGQKYFDGLELIENVQPKQKLPSAYYQYNGINSGEYTFAYCIELYGNKNIAEGHFYIRNSSTADEADEQLFNLEVSVHKEVGVDRSEYMLNYLDEIKENILSSMGVDEALDAETMQEFNKEILAENSNGKQSTSLVPQKEQAQAENSKETEDIQYEEVIGDVDVDTSTITASDMSELVAGLDFKVDDSIYDYDSLGLNELIILAPGSQYITGYTDSGIEAVFDAFDVTIKCQTTNVALQAGVGDAVLADTDRYAVYRWTTSDENNANRSYQRYIIFDKATGAGMNIHLEISKHDINAANAFIDEYLPAFELTLANNF